MSYNQWAVIVPTCRPDKFCEFLDAWLSLFRLHNIVLYVVEDSKSLSKDISKALKKSELTYKHFCHTDLPWFIPKGTDMIRSYGILELYKNDNNFVTHCLSLDDDVVPNDYRDLFEEYNTIFELGGPLSTFFDVGGLTDGKMYMRGFPYNNRKRVNTAVQYGGWCNNLDLNAIDQFTHNERNSTRPAIFSTNSAVTVPYKSLTTCCAMNMAWDNNYSPIMWQLPMIDGYYNRMGDIWSGLFIKKVLDAQNLTMVINGRAHVEHMRASDPMSNLKKEVLSFELNDELWEVIDKYPLRNHSNFIDSYIDITNVAFRLFSKHNLIYANHFLKARNAWIQACQQL